MAVIDHFKLRGSSTLYPLGDSRIDHGTTSSVVVATSGQETATITFNKSYTNAPTVVFSVLDTRESTATDVEGLLYGVTATGAKVLLHNYGGSAATVQITWIAIGE